MDGILEPNKSPQIKIRIRGVLEQQGQEFDAIIDTGFTGTIAMPMVKAMPLGLVLSSIGSYELADGSTSRQLLCIGFVEFEGQKQSVLIALSPGNDVLVGTEFFTNFGLTLTFNYSERRYIIAQPVRANVIAAAAKESVK